MSARLNMSIGIGTLVVMLIMSVGVLYFTKQGIEQSEHNNEDIDALNKTFTQFREQWTERVKIGNTNTNNTQDLILDTQKNILGNLTGHRIVTNETFEHIGDILNTTKTLTSDEYSEQAEGKVKSILGNMSKEHDIIFKALNITKNDTDTDAETDIEQIRKQLEILENRTK